MNYFLIAGEASGDLHASNLIKELRKADKNAVFAGLGGDKMRAEGCKLYQDYREMAYMGVIAVVTNLDKIKKNFQIAQDAILKEKPDVLVLIDYPSFNLKMAEFCKKHLPSSKICYYIPPKIWAWKSWRVHKIAQLSDKILGIFPFEPDFYQKYGYSCEYIGNPTMDSIRQWKEEHLETEDKLAEIQNEQREKIIALLPGSRKNEIKHCLGTMLEAARRINEETGKQYKIIVTAAPGIDENIYKDYLETGEELTRDTYQLISKASAAVVNSGTATLETALLGCPQTAVYYIACSKWLGWIKPFVFRIPYFTLVNIIPGKEVIKEQIAYNFTRKNIENELRKLLNNEPYRNKMLEEYRQIASILGGRPAAKTAAEMIYNHLG
ncbi:MAG: lipid-A-disaccharide synthase [Paludibacteraceae bacterium]|nr:lipid-A-disaccharide synthase [Paludibacteraceae bacterium]